MARQLTLWPAREQPDPASRTWEGLDDRQQKENPYQRKGIGPRMVRALIDWARQQGWTAIEANAYADLPRLYAVAGRAGGSFWQKLGFRIVHTGIESAFVEGGNQGLVRTMLKEAAEQSIDAGTAKGRYTMRFDLV